MGLPRRPKVLQEKLEQEKMMANLGEMGIEESDRTLLFSHIEQLQAEYLVTRLQIAGEFEKAVFYVQMIACLNKGDN